MRRRRRNRYRARRRAGRADRPGIQSFAVLGVVTLAALAALAWHDSTTAPPLCPADTQETEAIVSGSATAITTSITQQRYDCASAVVLVDPQVHDTLAAARFAIENNAVVLATTTDDLADIAQEVERLAASTVYWPGESSAVAEITRILDRETIIIENDDAGTIDVRLDVPALEALTPQRSQPDSNEAEEVDRRPLFLVSQNDLELGALVAPAVVQSGARMKVIDLDSAVFELDGQPSSITLVGNPDPTELWQYEGLLEPRVVLGGGTQLFPERRFVAFYGSPATPTLGVLGESAGPEEAFEALQPFVAAYTGDGVTTVPAFEIIVTVATTEPGSDGDYSSELFLDQIRPWVDTAETLGVYVILDLQPGRSDFLRQAKIYEEFLIRPNVGLALDPEWRLFGQQRHLEQIGTVDGAEVEEVSQWLAKLVRENGLPQKLFIVHQFQQAMLTNPELISTPPELATVIHVDGQGDRALKLNTYGALAGLEANQSFWFGWKNFFDEDNPLSTPNQVLELDPTPVVITYQ